MAGKIKIDAELCKGCGLCVLYCPKKCIVISQKSNKKGYFPAKSIGNECTGCMICAIICPDVVIEVSRDVKIETVETRKSKEKELLKDKT